MKKMILFWVGVLVIVSSVEAAVQIDVSKEGVPIGGDIQFTISGGTFYRRVKVCYDCEVSSSCRWRLLDNYRACRGAWCRGITGELDFTIPTYFELSNENRRACVKVIERRFGYRSREFSIVEEVPVSGCHDPDGSDFSRKTSVTLDGVPYEDTCLFSQGRTIGLKEYTCNNDELDSIYVIGGYQGQTICDCDNGRCI